MPNEDGPTITDATAPVIGEGGRTHKPRVSELSSPTAMQTCVPCRSKHTSMRPEYRDGLNDSLVSVRGHFVRQALTEIPAC
jgi:hypothetical protein